jgi:ribonuclease HI
MELIAVLNAINALKQTTELYIHTDSTMVIGLLYQGWKRKEATLRELCEQIEAAAQEKDVTLLFAKVKGHSGDDLNEQVDKLARAAAEQSRSTWANGLNG